MYTQPPINPFRAIKIVAAATLLASATPAAFGQSGNTLGEALPIEALKDAYLDCEREAIAGRIDSSRIMQCSVLYEDLKRRAFDGDFNALKRWSDQQPGIRPALEGSLVDAERSIRPAAIKAPEIAPGFIHEG